ncbi:STAS domain-containing protein [Aquibacillus sp. 3ASR75-54]|uniref:STAS domain-containing protein n=2 Tax=Aquibacillus salsiterrae TaxID=2950439 RepID=A0A9X3WEF6_9BACI|nr:STAS domain-containing protein [Aquibacillus salsiterrae]MDC3418242.1 STAS domain-containing protein [Aquibacillus salsiterrae]
MDDKPYNFTEKDIQLFVNLASMISYVLEVDDAYKEITRLSAPIVPICEGVAILPLVGKLREERASEVTTIVVKESQQLNLDYLIIDLSGASEIENEEAEPMLKMVNVLSLVGIQVIFTGMRPEFARHALSAYHELGNPLFSTNLERALHLTGVEIKRKNKLD